MKRSIIFFLLFNILAFAFINNVKADLNCSDTKKVVVIEESLATPAKFQAKMPICGRFVFDHFQEIPVDYGLGTPEGIKEKQANLEYVRNLGDQLYLKEVLNFDNKGTISEYTPVCIESLSSYIIGHISCHWEKDVVATKKCVEKKVEKICDPICKQKYLNSKKESNVTDLDCPSGCDMITNEVCLKEEWICPEGDGPSKKEGFTNPVCHIEGDYNDYQEKSLNNIAKELDSRKAEIACDIANSASGCKCDKDSIYYSYDCPVYRCDKVDKLIDICTPQFKTTDGTTVYCVNPGQPFSSSFSSTAGYIKDEEFSIRNCETSYSSVDCGYANILIESTKYKLDEKITELALRLWAVHNQQKGFDYVGVSSRSGSDCKQHTFFMKDKGYNGVIVNPYDRSYREFRESFLELAREYFKNYGYINPTEYNDYYNFFISCDSSKLGVACGDNDKKEYMQAFALLASTILGNSKMQEHLSELFKDEINEEVEGVNLITDEKGDQYIEVHYDEIKNITKKSNVKINCKELDKMVEEKIITEEQKNQIEPYCHISAVLVDGKGNVLQDLTGCTPNDEEKNDCGTPDYCYKDYCRTKVEKFAICDIETTVISPIQVRVIHREYKGNRSINKYVSCSNPANNQFLFGFDTDLLENEDKEAPYTIDDSNYTVDYYPITNYRCAGRCDNYNLRENMKDVCDDNTDNYDNAFNSSIKDPSLKCIVNMGKPDQKNMYDYSSYFGVNTQICRIYCSDQVNFHIADKKKVTSGTKFYYDIESSVRNEKNIKYLFTDIVQMKRSCVSEIYYNNPFPEIINWKKIYSLGKRIIDGEIIYDDGIETSEIESINNWKTLFSVIVKKSLHEGGKEEIVNKLLYDLMNCNLYTEKQIKDAGVKKPSTKIAPEESYIVRNGLDDEKVLSLNAKKNIINEFSEENKYGFIKNDNCKVNKNINECITMDNIVYDFGSSLVPDPAKLGSYKNQTSIDMKSISSIKNNFDNLIYCSGYDCFAYDPDHEEREYDYPTDTENKTKDISVATSDGRTMNFYGKNKITIPTNDYVMFEITADVSFYNASSFNIKPSGETINSTKTTKDKYLNLERFAYPISKDAYNIQSCTARDFLNANYHRCTINHSFPKIKTFFRKEVSDQFTNELNKTKRFACFVDVRRPVPPPPPNESTLMDSTFYRNVDLSNMFPSSSDGYTTNKNSNWATDNGKNATNQILASSKELQTTDNYLEYRVVLNPTQIKNIKEYNKNKYGYMNEIELNCQIVNNTYQNCKSPFIDELRTSTEYGTLDLEHITRK